MAKKAKMVRIYRISKIDESILMITNVLVNLVESE